MGVYLKKIKGRKNISVSLMKNYRQAKMEPSSKIKEGRFSYKGIPIVDFRLFTLKGGIQREEINISINANIEDNYINSNLANQLLILEPNIGEREGLFDIKEYEINDLQVTTDHYEYIPQFCVVTMFNPKIDIILGKPWLKELDTFMLNLEKKIFMFPYKRKMNPFQDESTKSKPIKPSLEDFKDISKLMFQDNNKNYTKEAERAQRSHLQ